MSTDLFEQLLAFTWRDVGFPVTKMTVSLAHDLVEHKYWGVDGARIEATGLAPMRFSASIPFINGLAPGRNEKWKDQALYPKVLRKFLAACALKTTGILTHPELGEIPCKCERVEFDWSGDRQGGAECQVSWIETKISNDTDNPTGDSPVQGIGFATQSLDASDANLRLLIPTLPKYKKTLSDLFRGVQGIFDTVTLLENTTAGKINSIVYRIETVDDSIDRAKSALTWKAKNDIERVKEAADNLRENILKTQNRYVLLFEVKGDTTVAGLCQQIPDTTLRDLIALNPALMRQAEVYKGTIVRHYAALVA